MEDALYEWILSEDLAMMRKAEFRPTYVSKKDKHTGYAKFVK